MEFTGKELGGAPSGLFEASLRAPFDGTYFMYNIGAQKFLDVTGSQLHDGASIIAYPLNEPISPNQKARLLTLVRMSI